MRTFGRDHAGNWIAVETDANGNNDAVWATNLVQNLKLIKGESPIYSTAGISAQQSILNQIAPDVDVNLIQQKFSPYFMSLVIKRLASTNGPTYNYDIDLTTNAGIKLAQIYY
jgi:hypothetical protein